MLRLLLSSTFNMSRTLSRRLVVSSRTETSVGQQLRGFLQLHGPHKAPCILSQRRRLLQTSRQFPVRQIASAGGEALAEQQIEPGTPEAPPQVPPQLDTVPGTDTAVEEVVSSKAETSNAAPTASPGVVSEAAAAPPAADVASSPGTHAFEAHWQAYMVKLEQLGWYTTVTDEGVPMSPAGAVKRASVECGRQRPDALYDLSVDKIKSFVTSYGEPPHGGALTDRKCFNSMGRLRATFVEGVDLPVGTGGAGSFQDVCRVLWAVHSDLANVKAAAAVPEGLVASGAELLQDIVELLGKEPSPAALAKAEEAAANHARMEDELAAKKSESRAQKFRELKQSAPASNTRPGDWTCPECNGNNFARNFECFRCRAARPAGAGRGSDREGWYEPASPPRGASNLKPGDWICPDCEMHNFASKTACYRCSLPRPEGAEVDAYGGGSGRGYAPSGYQSSGRSGSYFDRRSSAPRGQAPKAGDWVCTDCGISNFARREECFSCGTPRSADAEEVTDDTSFGGSARFGQAPLGGGRFESRIERGGGPRNSGGFEKRPGDWDCPECSAHNFASKEACFRCGIPKPPGSEYAGVGESSFRGRGDGFRGRGDGFRGRSDGFRGRGGFRGGRGSGGRGGGGRGSYRGSDRQDRWDEPRGDRIRNSSASIAPAEDLEW